MLNADRIKADLVAAMKSGDALKVSVLRMLSSALGYKRIEVQRELVDEDVLLVVGNEAKKRREAIESYTQANRLAQAGKEQQELEILQGYLPKQLTGEEIEIEIEKMRLPSDFAQAMKIAAPAFKGRADGGLVAQIVRERLGHG